MTALNVEVPVLPRRRLHEVDELKGLAIILVVLYHAGGVLIWNNYLHGDVGVDLFVILSGFGLTFTDRAETSFAAFMRRRLVRIMPAYWIVLTACLLGNIHFLQLHYGWGDVVAHFAGLHAFGGDFFAFSINDSFWFVTLILFLYVCHWALRPLLDRLDVFLFQSGLVAATVALTLFFLDQGGLMGHAGFRLPGFFLGMIAAHALKTGRCHVPLNPASAAGLLLFIYVPYTHGIFFHPPLVGIAIMIGYLLIARPWLARWPRILQVLTFLGINSFEIFLIHQPLMRNYNYYLHGRWLKITQPSPTSLIVGMGLALTVTLMVSVELHRLLARFTFSPPFGGKRTAL